MTRTAHASDLPLVTIDLRRAGELIATPCRCGHRDCTLGAHVLRATADHGPGARAANLDPSTRGARWDTDADGTVWPVPADPTGEAAVHPAGRDAHAEMQQALSDAQRACRALIELIQAYRPDRRPDDVEDPVQWCEHHMATLGVAEPRHRGDLCRTCYDFQLAHRTLPPVVLLQRKREGRRWTDEEVADAIRHERARTNPARRRRGRKAS